MQPQVTDCARDARRELLEACSVAPGRLPPALKRGHAPAGHGADLLRNLGHGFKTRADLDEHSRLPFGLALGILLFNHCFSVRRLPAGCMYTMHSEIDEISQAQAARAPIAFTLCE